MAEFVSINRRTFIRNSGYAAAALMASQLPFNEILARDRFIPLTILHTNDWHSRIEPFPKNDPNFPGLGGAEVRAAVIDKIRQEQKQVLLLDAGDMFQGTPYFNIYGGEPEFKLMSAMGYDAVTLGNHDFDNGLEGLIRVMPHAQFAFVNANYQFEESALKKRITPWTIFHKGPIKIGVFGIGIELNGLVPTALYGNTKYLNPIETANQTATLLKKEEKCDFVICLSHLGYSYPGKKVSDVLFAKESEHIDLIIGGHTHTFLNEPQEYVNKLQKKVLVNQVGWAGIMLGRIDYVFDHEQKTMHHAQSFNGNLQEFVG